MRVCLRYASRMPQKITKCVKKTELPKKGDNGSPEKNVRGAEKGISPLPLL